MGKKNKSEVEKVVKKPKTNTLNILKRPKGMNKVTFRDLAKFLKDDLKSPENS